MEKEQKYRSGKNLNEKGPHIKEVVNFPLPPQKVLKCRLSLDPPSLKDNGKRPFLFLFMVSPPRSPCLTFSIYIEMKAPSGGKPKILEGG